MSIPTPLTYDFYVEQENCVRNSFNSIRIHYECLHCHRKITTPLNQVLASEGAMYCAFCHNHTDIGPEYFFDLIIIQTAILTKNYPKYIETIKRINSSSFPDFLKSIIDPISGK